MPKFPTTEEELKTAGYKFKSSGQCKSCRAPFEWWETPNGKNIPLDPGSMKPHWTTCPNASEHRK